MYQKLLDNPIDFMPPDEIKNLILAKKVLIKRTIYFSLVIAISYVVICINFNNWFNHHVYVEGRDNPKQWCESTEWGKFPCVWINDLNEYHQINLDGTLDWKSKNGLWHKNFHPLNTYAFLYTIFMILLIVIYIYWSWQKNKLYTPIINNIQSYFDNKANKIDNMKASRSSTTKTTKL